MMTEEDPAVEMKRFLSGLFPSAKFTGLAPLAGDASSRTYYRAFLGGEASVVVMVAPEDGAVEAFAEMTSLMTELGAPTPSVYGVGGRMLAMEDLGDELLQDRAAGLGREALLEEYKRHIDDLIVFQDRAMSHQDRSPPCFSLAFDSEKLLWEVDFANRHFLQEWLGADISPRAMEQMNGEWRRIAGELAEEMEVLAHRDLHSRNIMCLDGRRVWLDFQDARMGRRQYDLASLLLDPYVDLPPEMTDELAGYYHDRLTKFIKPPWSRDRFFNLYQLSGLQRVYKALGTYGYQSSAKGVDVYEKYIPTASQAMRRILSAREDLKPLRDTLGSLLPA